MRIIPDGIYFACGFMVLALGLSYFLNPWFGAPFYLLALFCLYFFRDPERTIPPGNVLVSPADGRIVAIRQIGPHETRVSIFLNIFNVHVNRTPIGGVVTDVYYQKGKFLVASHEAASSENEQNTLVIEGGGTRVVCRQIAGLIARRIVSYKQPGDRLAAGDRIGYIKFGSRVDVIFGPEWTFIAKKGDKVVAGSTILAKRSETGENHLTLKERFASPSGAKRPRRAAYALPTLFTSANIFLGFVAILQAFEGALAVAAGDMGLNSHFSLAAKAIAFAVLTDGLDGRIARMTNTTSEFGRELDSLADVITFGFAPAVLIFVWGVYFVPAPAEWQSQLTRAGYLAAFLYLLCGAVRLARFNVQTNPAGKPSTKPDFKHFVGVPIPAGAGFIASVVYISPAPVTSFTLSIAWLVLVMLVGILMVSTWRYPSFKQIGISKPHTPLIVLLVGGVGFMIWEWSQPVLLAASSAYLLSGIFLRFSGSMRRRKGTRPSNPPLEHPVG